MISKVFGKRILDGCHRFVKDLINSDRFVDSIRFR